MIAVSTSRSMPPIEILSVAWRLSSQEASVLVPLLIGTELPCLALRVRQSVQKQVQMPCHGFYGVIGAINIHNTGIQISLKSVRL